MSVETEHPADVKPTDFNPPQQHPPPLGPILDPLYRRMPEGVPIPSTLFTSPPRPEEVHPRADVVTPIHDAAGPEQRQAPARVPIPPHHVSSISSSSTRASPPSGPMSSNVVIPPRPRPGRKPIPQEDAADRRRLQNRIAQRNFRDKRQQKLYETQQELEERKQEYQERINELERQLADVHREKKAQAEEFTTRIREVERRAKHVQGLAAQHQQQQQQQSQVYNPNPMTTAYSQPGLQPTAAPGAPFPGLAINTSYRGPMGPYGGSSVPTPPEDETDFTHWGRSSSQQQQQQQQQHQQANTLRPSASNETMDFTAGALDAIDNCGFCTDDQNCPCRDGAQAQAQQAQQQARQQQQQPTTAAPEAGTCAACLGDPERAAACRDLATVTRMLDDNNDPSSAASSTSASRGRGPFDGSAGMLPPPPAPPRMSCATLIDRFGQQFAAGAGGEQRTGSISELFMGVGGGGGGQLLLEGYPSVHGGYEVEEQEAAQVLQSLSRKGTLA